MRLKSTILLGLLALLGSCRSPNGRSLGMSMSHRLDNFASDFNRFLIRQDRLSSLGETTTSLIRLDTAPKPKSDLSKYLFWDRNFNRLSGVDFNKLGREVIRGPHIATPPGTQGLLSAGSLTDPRLRGTHFAESFKQLYLLEQRFPDLAGWQSVHRD